ncbi:hypothetical protein PUNSTDRAFT_63180, partial [Punctularia strigosozonata HHB-11173 SS5]|uniref:uncharacterized protein n=1 Tax=Punctularia strigosozonata (strain HHB-11173) TaxID=741275 RepID=UPI0004417D19
MATSHTLEASSSINSENLLLIFDEQYSKSSRAKCHGPPPCKGTAIGLGDLRYGSISHSLEYGEVRLLGTMPCTLPSANEWKRWSNGDTGTSAVTTTFRPEDQQKIRNAVISRRIDPSDVPESAKQ